MIDGGGFRERVAIFVMGGAWNRMLLVAWIRRPQPCVHCRCGGFDLSGSWLGSVLPVDEEKADRELHLVFTMHDLWSSGWRAYRSSCCVAGIGEDFNASSRTAGLHDHQHASATGTESDLDDGRSLVWSGWRLLEVVAENFKRSLIFLW
jgi:hypothetical protein